MEKGGSWEIKVWEWGKHLGRESRKFLPHDSGTSLFGSKVLMQQTKTPDLNILYTLILLLSWTSR